MQYKKTSITLTLVLISFLFVNTELFSQGPNMERVNSQRITFFTERLDLSEKESQNFWPVYNDYKDQKEKINRQSRSLARYVSENINDMSEEEIDMSLQKYIGFEKTSHQLFIKYN